MGQSACKLFSKEPMTKRIRDMGINSNFREIAVPRRQYVGEKGKTDGRPTHVLVLSQTLFGLGELVALRLLGQMIFFVRGHFGGFYAVFLKSGE